MASKIRTKVYGPDQDRVTHTIPGRVDDDVAITLTRQHLEEQILAAQEILDAGDDGWTIVVTATAPSTEVSDNGNGDVTFPADETALDDVA